MKTPLICSLALSLTCTFLIPAGAQTTPDAAKPGPAPAAAPIFFDSFEGPAVTARTPLSAGGDITKAAPAPPGEKPTWVQFRDYPGQGADGSVVAGLTPGPAHSGKQALFVEANKLSAPYVGALFVTRPIAITGGNYYKAYLWALNDAKKPLRSADAQLFLKIQIDFYEADGRTEAGMAQYLLQPLPGGKGGGQGMDTGSQSGHPLVAGARNVRKHGISTTEWAPVGFHFGTPASARTMVITFRCDSSSEKGLISGGIYFDDLTVVPSVETRRDIMGKNWLRKADSDLPGDAERDAQTEAEAAAIPDDPNAARLDPTPDLAPETDKPTEKENAAAENEAPEELDDFTGFQKPTLAMPGGDELLSTLVDPAPPKPLPTPTATPAPSGK